MATKAAITGPNGIPAAGIFADPSLDGPEIGTLVIVIDRAKNLPNRKSMGKQSPYCAARLGKEAKKTETVSRGGQTPKWDQELRFTVHDSPDFYNLKISVFSEDKKTDLIGEAWVSLAEVVVPGGGKMDLWQGLNWKGKYAGEVRIELTFYDSRPKPEKPVVLQQTAREGSVGGGEEEWGLRQSVGSSGKVKRRPLPANPNGVTPEDVGAPGVAVPGRAKHGPRDFRTPPRAMSMPPETIAQPRPTSSHSTYPQPYSSAPPPAQQMPANIYGDAPQSYEEPEEFSDPYATPDFLPQLPPSERQRTAWPDQHQVHLPSRPPQTIGLPHSHSAPVVPSASQVEQNYEDEQQLNTDYPAPIPDLDYQHQQLRQRRTDVPPGWQDEYGDPYAHEAESTEHVPPPPPPLHSNSAPAVPQYPPSQLSLAHSGYMDTPPAARHHSVPASSPLQKMERQYMDPPHAYAPPRSEPRPISEYVPVNDRGSSGWSAPNTQASSPYSVAGAPRPTYTRHSIADPYGTTPTRPHPLSYEVPRARSPNPYGGHPEPTPQPMDQLQHHSDYRGRNAAPLIKPRAVSPRPAASEESSWQPRNTYSLQFPVRAFESSDNSPLSTSRPPPPLQDVSRVPPTRKSISSRPPPPPSSDDVASGGVPFSPDSYNIHNPRLSRGGRDAVSGKEEPQGPILGWHGQEIDPSDHLPVDSWAPEPEKKTPTKTYGLGRDRDFGPRSVQSTPGSAPAAAPSVTGGGRLGKDTIVNVRVKSAHTTPTTDHTNASPTRNKLTKRSLVTSGGLLAREQEIVQPLRERHNYNPAAAASSSIPDPYAAGNEYSRSFTDGRPIYGGGGPPPPPPPKVPLSYYAEQQLQQEPDDALAREIGRIDIGSGSGSRYHSHHRAGSSIGDGGDGATASGSIPVPTAYVPVRSHRDRNLPPHRYHQHPSPYSQAQAEYPY